MVTFLSSRTSQFAYFNAALNFPQWQGKKVLDFGGNIGGFLEGANRKVEPKDYWCIDINQPAIEAGKRTFADAHFLHYDRYSSEYNPEGKRHLAIPNLEERFDFIIAFSVFTHVHQCEMQELVSQLRQLLTPAGRLAFTFTDQQYDRSLSDPTLPQGSDILKHLQWEQTKNPDFDPDGIAEQAYQSNWCVLIDGQLHTEPNEDYSHQVRQGKAGESYCTFYGADYMKSLFPDALIVNPVSPEWQHCCILSRLD